MNLSSGIFTVPRSGIYSFTYLGSLSSGSPDIALCVNNVRIGEADAPALSVQSTLQLNAGDEVTMQLFAGSGLLGSSSDARYHHFSGWLLEEDFSK
jgi:hypothetical protein